MQLHATNSNIAQGHGKVLQKLDSVYANSRLGSQKGDSTISPKAGVKQFEQRFANALKSRLIEMAGESGLQGTLKKKNSKAFQSEEHHIQ